jgi:hypothetical protein
MREWLKHGAAVQHRPTEELTDLERLYQNFVVIGFD